ncbi:MAG: hypothetical protein M1816_003027 [Peltula sp. TS41687]|nr:MAG: hypothetical protein M1816_003027 [Peltula sp. TS41687]
MASLTDLVKFPYQRVLMTTTLSPYLHAAFVSDMALSPASTITIRAPTNRDNIAYFVRIIGPEECYKTVQQEIFRALNKHSSQCRMIVYTSSIHECEELAESLACQYYHGRVSESDRQVVIGNWVQGTHKVLVGTSALAPVWTFLTSDPSDPSSALVVHYVLRLNIPGAGKERAQQATEGQIERCYD